MKKKLRFLGLTNVGFIIGSIIVFYLMGLTLEQTIGTYILMNLGFIGCLIQVKKV